MDIDHSNRITAAASALRAALSTSGADEQAGDGCAVCRRRGGSLTLRGGEWRCDGCDRLALGTWRGRRVARFSDGSVVVGFGGPAPFARSAAPAGVRWFPVEL